MSGSTDVREAGPATGGTGRDFGAGFGDDFGDDFAGAFGRGLGVDLGFGFGFGLACGADSGYRQPLKSKPVPAGCPAAGAGRGVGDRAIAPGRASASAARLAFSSAYFFHSAMPPLMSTTSTKMMSSVFLMTAAP